MSLGKFVHCKHAQPGDILNLENISIIAICSGSVSVLIKDSNGPKSLRTWFLNYGVSMSCRQVVSHIWQWKRESMTHLSTSELCSIIRRERLFIQLFYIHVNTCIWDTLWEMCLRGIYGQRRPRSPCASPHVVTALAVRLYYLGYCRIHP